MLRVLTKIGALTTGATATGSFQPPKQFVLSSAEQPLRIAIVYSRSPMPMRRGDQLTVAHLLAFLKARGHVVDLYTLQAGGAMQPQDRAWLEEHCRSLALIPHRLRDVLSSLVRGILHGLPLQVLLFQNSRLCAALAAGLQYNRYDIVYVYYVRSAETLRRALARSATSSCPVTYLAMQLSQTLNARRIANLDLGFGERLLYRLETRLLGRYEANVWRLFTRTVLIGRKDAAAIEEECRARGGPIIDNYVLIPHGVDTHKFAPRPDVSENPKSVTFFGGMETNINVAAAVWFAREVWPLILSGEPKATYRIAGRSPREELRSLHGRNNIIVIGEVSDASLELCAATVCINPIQAGAGMQNKLLEYLSCGRPVVATAIANEGIGAIPERDLLVADDAAAFAGAVLRLLRNPGERRRLGNSGRNFVLRNWTWEAHFAELERDMVRTLDAGTAHAHHKAENPRTNVRF